MSNRYLSIIARQVPFSLGLDETNRSLFSCNYGAVSDAITELEEDIAKLISDATLGTRGTNLFLGPDSKMPGGDGPYITISEYDSGMADETHNGDVYPHRAFQIVVRATNFRDARTRAQALWTLLHGQRNITVTA